MLLTKLDENKKFYASVVNPLHQNWEPHKAQAKIGRAFFQKLCRYVFAECGRNFGKTELIVYLHARWAQMNGESENYYFSPLMKQSREIVWETGRYLKIIPPDWIESVNNQEMRIRFKNGSFIKLDGSDNTEAYRGVKPKGLSVLDEFKDFKPEFWEAFEPNLIHGSAFIVGTPPKLENEEHQFFKVADEFERSKSKQYFNFPSSANPHIPKEWLKDKKEELYARGEGYIWEREYEAKRVRGGNNKIFPMLSPSIVRPHSEIIKEIKKHRKRMIWDLWADPAASSCFAVLFVAINPFTKDIYALDEIYEQNQANMSVRIIGSELIKKRNKLWDGEWRQGYDEAATWWRSEMWDHFGEFFEPTRKQMNKKDVGISLTKDILIGNKLHISDRCVKFFWELDNYAMINGEIPKKNDHQIDNFRYILGAEGYEFSQSTEKKEEDDENFRGARIEDDFPYQEEDYREWEP